MLRITINSVLSSLVGCTALFLNCSIAHSTETLTTTEIHTRTLAASCAACHGTNGNSHSTTPVLASLDATHFISQMQAFKDNSRPSTVMHHHAAGLTKTEIEQLAHYFSQQKRMTSPELQSQMLETNHE